MRILASAATGAGPNLCPLTHHEIIRLVAPFARAGRHVDLARSDRSTRVIVFKPVEHQGEYPSVETLQLENPRPGLYRLTRRLTLAGGLNAMLRAEASNPNDLLAHIEKIPPHSQFRSVSGVLVALCYDIRPSAQIALARAEARFEGLTLTVVTSRVAGIPATIDLVPNASHSFQLPEDLLAVLGRQWTVLHRRPPGWRGSLLVRGTQQQRTRLIETYLEQAVAHLSATLAKPPVDFHATLRLARWRVVLRRATPLLTFFALMAGAWGSSFLQAPPGSIMRFLIVSSPAILLILAFTIPNRPPIEIPALPRRLSTAAWPQPPESQQA